MQRTKQVMHKSHIHTLNDHSATTEHNTAWLGGVLSSYILTSTAMFLHRYAIMQDTNRGQHAMSFTGIRFRRLGREPLLGRRPGSRWGLAPCSWTPRFLNSSSTQETSRADSISGPEEHCSDQTLYQLVHLVHSHVKYVQCHGVNLYIVYSPSCLKKVSHATTRRENPRTLDW